MSGSSTRATSAFRDPVAVGRGRDPRATPAGKYLTEDEIYAAALAAEPGADAERRAALRVEAGKKARKNVAFLDATFSVQKSITVLHTAFEAQEVQARSAAEQARSCTGRAHRCTAVRACTGAVQRRQCRRAVHASGAVAAADRGAATAAEAEAAAWAEHRQAVEDAIWAGNQAALEYLSDKAGYSRVGHHGGAAGRWVDAHDWTVASFFQHDSRDHDPQLHIHNAILNRVEGGDGKWRTLDSKAIAQVPRRRVGGRGPGDGTAPDPLAGGAVRDAPGRQGPRDRRDRPGGDGPVLLPAPGDHPQDPDPGEGVRDQVRPGAELAWSWTGCSVRRRSRPAAPSRTTGETVEQRLERWDTQLRAEVARRPARRSPTTSSPAAAEAVEAASGGSRAR